LIHYYLFSSFDFIQPRWLVSLSTLLASVPIIVSINMIPIEYEINWEETHLKKPWLRWNNFEAIL
jgi:hypothetical protein